MTFRPLPRMTAALAALALVVGACGSSTPTPTAAPTAAPASIAVPSPAPASGATASQPAGSGAVADPSAPQAVPSFLLPSEDKDLEARLPSQVNGIPLSKYSFSGTSFLASGSSNAQDLIELLKSLGKTPADMSIAFASDAGGGLDVQIGAFRVAGAATDALLAAFLAATSKETPGSVMTSMNVGGKAVTQIVDPADATSPPVYVYAKGDILYYLLTPDAALAAAALQAMP